MPLTGSQVAEVEALEAIFGPALELKTDEDAVEILLLPDTELGIDADENAVGLRLRIALPVGYPEGGDAPEITPIFKKNIGESRWKKIMEVIDAVTETHKGFEMLFDLYSAVTEWLQNNNEPELSLLEKMLKQKGIQPGRSKVEAVGETDSEESSEKEDENRPIGLADRDLVAADQRVTEVQFMRWREEFRKRMIEAGTWKDEGLAASRPSGKELFLSAKGAPAAVGGPKDMDAASEDRAEGQVFWGKEELYADEDVDLDDIKDDLDK